MTLTISTASIILKTTHALPNVSDNERLLRFRNNVSSLSDENIFAMEEKKLLVCIERLTMKPYPHGKHRKLSRSGSSTIIQLRQPVSGPKRSIPRNGVLPSLPQLGIKSRLGTPSVPYHYLPLECSEALCVYRRRQVWKSSLRQNVLNQELTERRRLPLVVMLPLGWEALESRSRQWKQV